MVAYESKDRAGKAAGQGASKQVFSANRLALAFATVALCLAVQTVQSKEQLYKEQIGAVPVEAVKGTATLRVPFITWGGDVATFHANGGLKTAPGSIFQKQGLNLELTPGDDFDQQVKDYIAGKSPFLRGTFSMVGAAAEVIGQDPRTQGVVIMQLTWSNGDHLVARGSVKTADDLKGKTILLQKNGPHVGMLDDILRATRLTWDDVNVVWTKDLTGTPDCPMEMFKKDAKYDACFAISPDMTALCGGLDKTGDGSEKGGAVKGSRVLVSTAQLTHSIADVYVCRKDFYDANKELVAKFVAGYLKGAEEMKALQAKYQKKEAKAVEDYTRLLSMAQNIYSKAVLPTLEDADGLVSDANFVHQTGNKSFFLDKSNLVGFDAFNTAAKNLATSRGYASKPVDLLPSDLSWEDVATLGALTQVGKEVASAPVFDVEKLDKSGPILEFKIFFAQNVSEFPPAKYSADFTRAVEIAAKFGNAAVLVRGHADPSNLVVQFVTAAKEKGILTQTDDTFMLRGKKFDLGNIAAIYKEIEAGTVDGAGKVDCKQLMKGLQELSQRRVETVRDTIVRFAKQKGWKLDPNQITPVGVGAREPVVALPDTEEEAQKNRRVEFRLVKIPAEPKSDFKFDY